MYSVQKFCEDVRSSAFGGSAEMVENGVKAFCWQIGNTAFSGTSDLKKQTEGWLDDALHASGSVLPQINFIIRMNAFLEKLPGEYPLKEAKQDLLIFLEQIGKTQKNSLRSIGMTGANLIRDGGRVSTFSTSGTVEEIYRQAIAAGKKVSASVFESRPHKEGKRTFKTLCSFGVKTVFGVDALMYKLIPGSDFFVIGADAVRATGEVYAKTGSYMAALVCRESGIPFYVAADTSKFDAMSVLGYPLRDSSRPWEESYDEALPENGEVRNISFELIPPQLVSGIITEKGIVSPQAFSTIAGTGELSVSMREKLAAWLKTKRF